MITAATGQPATTSIFDCFEFFHNRQHLHSGVGYLIPLVAEQQWQQSVAECLDAAADCIRDK